MQNQSKRQKRLRRMLKWSAYTLLLVLVLPLIPYAIHAATDATARKSSNSAFFQVPDPGTQLWREVRGHGDTVAGDTQVQGVDTGVLINSDGEAWRLFRMTKLIPYGAILMGAVLGVIALFYFVRGSLPVPGGDSGKKILRFTLNERIVHWFTVVIFWLLGVTGLILLYGRFVLIPLLGQAGFSVTASACKEVHNLMGPLFLFAMIALFFTFLKDNFYARGDLTWLSKAGGLMGGHVSAGRFNAGEKIWFWIATILGFALCVTGLILDFAVIGQSREVMALSHVVHGISALVVISISFGHIYLGTLGMQGSISSMANGYVDANWAKAHHDRWYEEVKHTVGEGEMRGGVTAGGVSQSRRDV